MRPATTADRPRPLTALEWTICAVAALGFAFDIYELLVLPLIVRPALSELVGVAPGSPGFASWVGLLFWLPALCGGVFGLLGGWLTDRFGRRRVLVWSILLYTISALASGFATSATVLLFFRCTTFIGVCVEFVAATAWLAELFPDPARREKVLGITQALSSIGGLLVTGAYYLAVHWADSLPAIAGGHQAWRYTLISGVLPALPLLIVRPFLPESPVWAAKRAAGSLARPRLAELFTPALRRTTIVTTILVAAGYGAAFGAIQQAPQFVPGLVPDLAKPAQQAVVSSVQAWQETGGLVGRVLLAGLAVVVVSRRKLLRMFQIPGLILVPLVFFFPAQNDLGLLKWGMFVAGLLTVAQFSFWGNYLPRVFPTHLRGTGESFAANVGGRMLGTSCAFLSTQLRTLVPGVTPEAKVAMAAGAVALFVYLVGVVASHWLPEPGAELPE